MAALPASGVSRNEVRTAKPVAQRRGQAQQRHPDALRAVPGSAGPAGIGDQLVERVDPRGEPYVWIGVLKQERTAEPGTDLAAVAEGWVSVTPIHLDMTHRPTFRHLANALGLVERAETS